MMTFQGEKTIQKRFHPEIAKVPEAKIPQIEAVAVYLRILWEYYFKGRKRHPASSKD